MLLALALAVAGCFDRSYGPKLTNAYGFDVVVTVDFDDGRSVTARWPVCRTVFFGSKEQVITTFGRKNDAPRRGGFAGVRGIFLHIRTGSAHGAGVRS